MTRANSCCHEAQVRVGCRGRYCRSRRSKSANALADLRRGREGRPYPVEIRENTGLFHRPMNWPVWSSVASIRKRLIPFVAAAGGRGLPSGILAGRVPAAARRRARRLPAQRAGQLQPLLRRQCRGRSDGRPHAGAPRSPQPGDRRARARARRALGVRGRRPHAHAAPAQGHHLLRRRAVHRSRRALLVCRRLRCGRQPAGRQHHRRRPAAPGHLPGSVDRGHSSARGVRAGPPHPRQPADPAAPQARRRLPQRHDPEGLGAIDAAVRDRRGSARSC